MLHRRGFLAFGALAAWQAGAGARPARGALRVAATWRRGVEHELGVLAEGAAGARLRVEAALPLPSRGHGVALMPDGSLLAVARRPGEWLLRWHPGRGDTRWCWIEADRCFNGHVLCSPDGRRLYTTESDLATGAGLVGVRDALTLQKLAEWPTHGQDPHELVWEPGGRALWVANGGIPASPETGRLKLALDRMDPSLVRLDTHDGALQGPWRLPDARLSLRHLAWTQGTAGERPVLGIALQAEHAVPAQRAKAPVLARFDGERLSACELPADAGALAGYGGDLCAMPGGWVVGCPRADTLGLWDLQGRWRGGAEWAGACAAFAVAAADGPQAWVAGRDALRQAAGERVLSLPDPAALQLDNHAVAWMVAG